ncbi:MAG: acyltransferase [Candidatus Midichloriaceae bacterium]|jgi:acetyl-CoA C-acetyltransferase|nr:acyltransferase [Candidatus Midichloriaceae bacterium]
MDNQQVAIVAAKRTAIGNFNGTLASVPAHILGEAVIRQLLVDSRVAPKEISEVIMGQILTAGSGQNPARQASIGAGLPKEVPAISINQVCGSGLRSVALGYQAIKTGASDIVIAGGQENMSLSPHVIFMRNGYKMGSAEVVDTMIKDGLTDVFNNYHMGITAENIAEQFGISRQQQDEFSVDSQNKAERAQKEGRFVDEIVPVKVMIKKEEIEFKVDEFTRHGVKIEDLSKLRPAFKKDGSVTAGNASGINDGAAGVVLMTVAQAKKRGLKILGIIKSFAQAGVAPEIMGIGPIPASQKALELAGWSVSDLDLIEANEAFASQAICVNKQMGWDLDKVNINGGAISLGHPIGASGARILVTLLHSMMKRNAKKGLATLCIGGGMGVAMCIEKAD